MCDRTRPSIFESRKSRSLTTRSHAGATPAASATAAVSAGIRSRHSCLNRCRDIPIKDKSAVRAVVATVSRNDRIHATPASACSRAACRSTAVRPTASGSYPKACAVSQAGTISTGPMRSSFGSPMRGPRAWRTIRTHPPASSSPAAATSAARCSRPSGANASGNVLASSLRITSRGQGVDRPYETLRSWLSSSLASSSLRGERVVALIACELLGEVENCGNATYSVLVNKETPLNPGGDQLAPLLGGCQNELESKPTGKGKRSPDARLVHLSERFVEQDQSARRPPVN